VLLDAFRDCGSLERYLPVDVSESALREAAERLNQEYADLAVHGVVADFTDQMHRLPAARRHPRLVAFLGSTVGNLGPDETGRFLADLAAPMRPGDGLLLGTDLVKDRSILEAAYNDPGGVTAAFNRNILLVLNRKLGADFVPTRFEHVAFFDLEHSWIEMRLRAKCAQSVAIPGLGLEIELAPGEEIRTEISCKYAPETVETMVTAAGFEMAEWYADPHESFAVSLSIKR
jgi:L-histidine N-alpha-methyltransferase